ncbi:GTPase HflX [compost metagenome]
MGQHIAVTEETLKALGADGIPAIKAYNKADLTELPYPVVKENTVTLSAKEKSGIAELIGLVRQHVFNDYIQCEILVPFDRGSVVSYFNNHADVQAVSYEEQGTRLKLECRAADYERFKSDFVVISQ